MKLALFDLDNTLLAGDSDFEWAQFLIEKGVLDREVYEARNVQFYEQYRAGTLDIHEFLDFQLKPLSRHPRAQLDAWRDEYVRRKILPMITRKSRDLVASHFAESGSRLPTWIALRQRLRMSPPFRPRLCSARERRLAFTRSGVGRWRAKSSRRMDASGRRNWMWRCTRRTKASS